MKLSAYRVTLEGMADAASNHGRELAAARWANVERVDKACAACGRLMAGVLTTREQCEACRIKAWRKTRRELAHQGDPDLGRKPRGTSRGKLADDPGEPRFCELPGCGQQLPAAARKDARYCSREHKEQARRLRAHSTPESFT